jgi:DNA-binding MarR family transcriptional regulator
MEAVSLLQHRVEQQLRAEGDLSYVQFQLLARLAGRGQLTMTELADGVVYSRSGLTYQAGLLEKAGLITRGPSPDDERATLVTITDNGRALLGQVMPGHIQVTRLLLDPLSDQDLHHLGDIMTRVVEATLAAHDEWVAAGCPGARSHEDVMAELLRSDQ